MRLFCLLFSAIFVAVSCASPKKFRDFDLQKETWEPPDSNVVKSYLKGTTTIDSVNPDNLRYDIWRIEIDKYPDTVKLFTRVFDEQGRFVSHMAEPYRKSDRKYFKAVDEYLGKVYNIRHSPIDTFTVREFGANDSIPYYITLTVDYSGSMTGVVNAIFEGTELFISMKYNNDLISFASFNKDFTVKVPFEKDKSKLLSEFHRRRLEGFGYYSGLYEAINRSILMFDELPDDGNPRLVVVFSDGDDNYSRVKTGEIIQNARNKKVHIFTVAFGYSIDDNLKEISFQTGGKFYKAYSKEDLKFIFYDIYLSLRNYYLITYKPPKYWGHHRVVSLLDIPGRKDSLFAEGFYDTSDMWKDTGDSFVRPIFFDFDKSDIKPESFPIIDEIVDQMMSRPKLRLEIQGHTDNVGTVEYNQNLSERRAKAVFDALIERGVDSKRLRWRGFGLSHPIAPNDSEEGRAKNRRTQFIILAK